MLFYTSTIKSVPQEWSNKASWLPLAARTNLSHLGPIFLTISTQKLLTRLTSIQISARLHPIIRSDEFDVGGGAGFDAANRPFVVVLLGCSAETSTTEELVT